MKPPVLAKLRGFKGLLVSWSGRELEGDNDDHGDVKLIEF